MLNANKQGSISINSIHYAEDNPESALVRYPGPWNAAFYVIILIDSLIGYNLVIGIPP